MKAMAIVLFANIATSAALAAAPSGQDLCSRINYSGSYVNNDGFQLKIDHRDCKSLTVKDGTSVWTVPLDGTEAAVPEAFVKSLMQSSNKKVFAENLTEAKFTGTIFVSEHRFGKGESIILPIINLKGSAKLKLQDPYDTKILRDIEVQVYATVVDHSNRFYSSDGVTYSEYTSPLEALGQSQRSIQLNTTSIRLVAVKEASLVNRFLRQIFMDGANSILDLGVVRGALSSTLNAK